MVRIGRFARGVLTGRGRAVQAKEELRTPKTSRLSLPTITIVIDSREQTPLVFTRFASVTGTLTTGDYSVVGLEELFAIEWYSDPRRRRQLARSNPGRFGGVESRSS
jgi:hypothetical protein